MRKLKIIVVVGARPQFVKAAALSPVLQSVGKIDEIILHTGQHFDVNMSDIFFQELLISPPKFNLGIGGGSHGENTGRMIEAIEKVLIAEHPDCVLVFGDTDSTLAAAIATSKLGIVLAHVEAGLRSFRRSMPEEINRILTDHVADVLYAPSTIAVNNLLHEGITKSKIVNTGDVMYDVVKRFSSLAEIKSTILKDLNLVPYAYNFLTMHRKENTDNPDILYRIIKGLEDSNLPIVFPVHPRTAKQLRTFGIQLPSSIIPINPLGYLDILKLQSHANIILTDSGGVQKEAYFLGRPCVTLRDETEWVELVECGANVLVGSDTKLIADLVQRKFDMFETNNLYGDGTAAQLISADLLKRCLV